jgi:LysM repeat protein
MCSNEHAFENRFRKLSAALGRHHHMKTEQHPDQTDFFPRRSQMSTATLTPGFTRTAPRRAPRPAARPIAPAPEAAARTVRLTRRGRIVATFVFLAVLMAVLTVFGAHSAATGEAGTPVPTRTVEVGPGDTLWNIASEVAAPGQTRAMVQQIEELNALTGSGLTVGQEIAVPVH